MIGWQIHKIIIFENAMVQMQILMGAFLEIYQENTAHFLFTLILFFKMGIIIFYEKTSKKMMRCQTQSGFREEQRDTYLSIGSA